VPVEVIEAEAVAAPNGGESPNGAKKTDASGNGAKQPRRRRRTRSSSRSSENT